MFLSDARYMTVGVFRRPARGWAGRYYLLRVVLDDELFLDLGVDLGPDGQRVHQDPHLVRDYLEPGRAQIDTQVQEQLIVEFYSK